MVSTPTSEDSKRAFDLRRRGKSLGYIAEHTAFNDAMEVARAIKAFTLEQSTVAEANRQMNIEMELARLDAWQEEVEAVLDEELWIYNKEGDAVGPDYDIKLKAVQTLLKVSKQRVELLGLNEADAAAITNNVYLVQGETKSYVDKLKEIVQAG